MLVRRGSAFITYIIVLIDFKYCYGKSIMSVKNIVSFVLIIKHKFTHWLVSIKFGIKIGVLVSEVKKTTGHFIGGE